MKKTNEMIKDHYFMDDLLAKIEAGLVKMGKSPESVELSDLAQMDELHVRGREATIDLLQALGINPKSYVLDVGSGLGGPARVAASQFEAEVKGIDLSDIFVDVGNEINRWLKLSDQIKLTQGDATELPFESDTFDFAYSIHASMNIKNKSQLYKAIHRVLRPNGKLGLYDILKGEQGNLIFPVPWADNSSTSFLVDPQETADLLTKAGFEIETMEDKTQKCLAWMKESSEKMKKAGGPSPLGLQIILGSSAKERVGNLAKNLVSGQARVNQIIARKK